MRAIARLAVWTAVGLLALCPPAPAAAPDALTVRPGRVERYAKAEFSIRVNRRYINPFDPGEIDLALEITTPGGRKIVLPAFWYQAYERDSIPRGEHTTDWLYPVGPPGWKARFAPAEIGVHTAVARLTDAQGTARSGSVSFETVASQSKGFVRAGRVDPRFLCFDDGTPFFAIGQNLAFIGPARRENLTKTEEVFGKLSRNGANFLRIWTCCEDWAMAIEARKSAWGHSWSWKPPFVAMPGGAKAPGRPKCVEIGDADGRSVSASTSHPLAVRPETRYVLSGRIRTTLSAGVKISARSLPPGRPVRSRPAGQWTEFRRECTTSAGQHFIDRITFCQQGPGAAWLDGLSLQESGGGPELLWEAAVNRPARGFYNPTDCFILDELIEMARRNGIYLQLCLLTRDLYMKSLDDEKGKEYGRAVGDARKLLRYAVARWGYSTSVASWEYFNEMNPGAPTDRFYDELGAYLERIDPHGHLRTTSAWSASPGDWRHARLDMAQLHHYLRPADEERGRDEAAAVLERTALLRKHAPRKPILLAEFGLAEDSFQRSRYMKRDKGLIHFHNALWASTLSGASGTALFWWWEELERMDAYWHYRPISEFVEGIPFGSVELRPAKAAVEGAEVRVVGLQGDDRAYLWLQNRQSTWYAAVVENQAPPAISGATLRVEGLAPGSYRVEWWDTWTGKPTTVFVLATEKNEARVPRFIRDTACRITRLAP